MVGGVRSSEFRAVAAVIVQGFSLATSVRGFGGDGQSCRSKSAREHQDQQQSGGQAMHGLERSLGKTFKQRIWHRWEVMQVARRMRNATNVQEVKTNSPICSALRR